MKSAGVASGIMGTTTIVGEGATAVVWEGGSTHKFFYWK